jgi:hypothetical protein
LAARRDEHADIDGDEFVDEAVANETGQRALSEA